MNQVGVVVIIINELEKYDEKNGCICGICEAKVAEKIGE